MMNMTDVAEAIRNRSLSPIEVLKDTMAKIKHLNPEINAFITVAEESALAAAKAAEQEIDSGHWRGPLHGIPIGLKDLVYTKGIRTTMGSKVYADFVPDEDAAVVTRIRRAGGIIIGKLNTHEFAYGPTGDRSYFGPVHNPQNPAKMTGGSSSGSAAALATGMCYAAIGTDTGGSVRIPSALCGTVGMKPTYGRVSKRGVFPLSQSLDHVGPMTRSTADNALFLNAIAGPDEYTPYVLPGMEDFTRFLNHDLHGKVIGIPANYFYETLDLEVEKAVLHAIEVFRMLGAEIREVQIPGMDFVTWAQPVVQKSEAYFVHEQTLSRNGEDLDEEVRERLLLSVEPKGYEYVKAIAGRNEVTRALDKVLEEVDILLAPTVPIIAPDINAREVVVRGKVQPVRNLLLRLTSPLNYTGQPALSIPCGKSSTGLPIGLQLISHTGCEAKIYQFAHQFERTVR
jgi:aspartyl-tRNA(Asn)/glutamyl-tRNA(Gln) amidotransferase subunit A